MTVTFLLKKFWLQSQNCIGWQKIARGTGKQAINLQSHHKIFLTYIIQLYGTYSNSNLGIEECFQNKVLRVLTNIL